MEFPTEAARTAARAARCKTPPSVEPARLRRRAGFPGSASPHQTGLLLRARLVRERDDSTSVKDVDRFIRQTSSPRSRSRRSCQVRVVGTGVDPERARPSWLATVPGLRAWRFLAVCRIRLRLRRKSRGSGSPARTDRLRDLDQQPMVLRNHHMNLVCRHERVSCSPRAPAGTVAKLGPILPLASGPTKRSGHQGP